MRPPTITDTDLVDVLGTVFSRYGYEGASISRLSEESGLKRASLYHRFPEGKSEIVEAVVNRATELFEAMLAPAFADGDPVERVEAVASGIRDYYDSGAKSCLIVALSVADEEHRAAASTCVEAWSGALRNIAIDAGFGPDDASNAAIDAVAAIEGALVIAATSGNTAPFERALESLPGRLTEGV